MNSSALLSDFYSLTMSQGYWMRNNNQQTFFEMFFRKQPYDGGYSIFAGLEPLLEELMAVRFSPEDITYLESLNFFNPGFLDFLREFRFTGRIWAMDEGQVIFPLEPLIRVQGNFIECQIIEGLLLNIINFQSLIATKAARVWLASKKGRIMEFGLRRAQGPDGALSASRASFIGGAAGTSNVMAGREYGIPVMGTMAHSWVMAFPTEEEAFQAYADIYPKHPIFLIDTYDTLRSGIKNAVKIGKKLAADGRTFGVRLDSGDIQYLSVEVRKILDAEGFRNATIAVSNDLDEFIIQTLTDAGAPIDSWGVGTQLVTGGGTSAFTGVYKLAAKQDGVGRCLSAMKFSDHPDKTTTPGIKQVWRVKDKNGMAIADVMALDACPGCMEESDEITAGEQYSFWHPSADYRHFNCDIDGSAEPLLKLKMEGGKLVSPHPSLADLQNRVKTELASIDDTHKRILYPHIYKVSITARLRQLKLDLIRDYLGNL